MLNVGWCDNTWNIIQIKVNEDNPFYLSQNNMIICRKSSNNSDVYDIITFTSRIIELIQIPSYVKQIDSCTFQFCRNLKNVEFGPNSNLQIIGQKAFFWKSIEKITIPKHVK